MTGYLSSKIHSRLFKAGTYSKEADKEESPGTFSQSGEDIIIDYLLKNHFGTELPSYLDIGAYDPVKFSNTYLFYQRGANGFLIEPDPDLADNIKKRRPRDSVLNIGVSDKPSEEDFYLVNPPTLNTFSKKEYEQYKLFYPDTTLRKIVKTKTIPINSLLEEHFSSGLDFLSIDVEGLDYQLVSSIDFTKYRPSVICIETVEYKDGNTWIKPKDIAQLLYKNSYFLYADTFINSIFVDKKRWDRNNQPKLKNFEGR
jgi:FkbM family methyltransferase